MRGIQDQLAHRAKATPDQLYLTQPIDRQWHTWTWAEAYDEARRMAAALERMGLQPGDRVGLISRNCAHWILADMAIILAGLVSVPVYPTAKAETIRQILEHSDCKLCFVGKIDEAVERLAGVPAGVSTIAMPYPDARGDSDWEELVEQPAGEFQTRQRREDDLATLLYTSGSTGTPKGAMHSFSNFAFVGHTIATSLGVEPGDKVFSYLPLSHCTERAYVEAVSFYAETSLYFAESIETFAEDLRHVRPTLFGSVPRLWKRFQLGVLEKLPPEKLDRLLKIPVVAGLVRRKIKKGLGLDRARWFASGSAPMAVSLLEWWDRVGVTIREGWGMTETFAYGTQIGLDVEPRFGTISRALPEAELKINDDQELLIRCPCLMQGYYKADELTAESMTDDGFFRTGDRAFIEDGFVTITGRVKELFKTAKGKYVAPVPVESLLARTSWIEIACVLGSGMTQPVALIQLAEHAPADRDHVARQLESDLEKLNRELEPHERLGSLIVVSETWEVDNGMLTPTLKIKRDVIEARYAGLIERASDRIHFES
ncbi:AMP-binding protein [Wenzhouxiangella sediminis]|uniref:AMP-dependent synthetase n=1 Tax=Wenzhouxiangella sediminis TaxID=1792836 RepID=A0A3E1KA34_9GAMM|nr:AMP-binding protein [Wenzhouxiangella sediminis]RFF31167.1 AMP-dependent synthetase [Wenzhouxiangella sediminis]